MNYDVVMIAEPRIINANGSLAQINHPAFALATHTRENTKIAIYINRRHKNYRIGHTRNHIAYVRFHMTTL